MTTPHTELEDLIEKLPDDQKPVVRAIRLAIEKMRGPRDEFDAACAHAQYELDVFRALKSRAALGENND